MQRTLRRGRLSAARQLALALCAAVVLEACGSGNDDSGAVSYNPWQGGGQTGSLTPLCGITPGALMRGVPASAAGIVIDPSECASGELNLLRIHDADGQAVPFEVIALPDGTLLLRFTNGLTPGSYTVGPAVLAGADEDAGVEPTVEIESPMNVSVEEPLPLPTHFGQVARVGGECGAVLELTPDLSVAPYLGVLSVDLQIDRDTVQNLVPVGTLQLMDGVARIDLLEFGLNDLWQGEHELRVTVHLAGESVPLETFILTVSIPCGEEMPYVGDDDYEQGCSLRPGHGSIAPSALVIGLALYALRKRRRRTRG